MIGAKDGGVFRFNDELRVTILDSQFKGNFASRTGGVILANNEVSLRIRKCTFEENYGFRGGVMYFSNAVTFLIEDSLFLSNRAAFFGAAIFLVSEI